MNSMAHICLFIHVDLSYHKTFFIYLVLSSLAFHTLPAEKHKIIKQGAELLFTQTCAGLNSFFPLVSETMLWNLHLVFSSGFRSQVLIFPKKAASLFVTTNYTLLVCCWV